MAQRFFLTMKHDANAAGNFDYEGSKLPGIPHAMRKQFFYAVESAWKREGLTGFTIGRWPHYECVCYTTFEVYEQTEKKQWVWQLFRNVFFMGLPVHVFDMHDYRKVRSIQVPSQNFSDRHFKAIEVLMRVWEQFEVE